MGKKYYIVRTSKVTGRTEYKMHKTLDNWCSESIKDKCWKFSKQGAMNYINRMISRGWNYDYRIEEARA